MRSVTGKFNLFSGVLFVLFSSFIMYRSYSITKKHVMEQAINQVRMAISFELAIRRYVGETLRPIIEGYVGEDEFIPEAMSTSFVARTIFKEVKRSFPDYIIKFSSDNPRNPLNKAGPQELRIIRYFNKNPELDIWRGEITINGKRYLAEMVPRRMQKRCLMCHGDPSDAPAQLIKRYGTEGGFYRRVGEVIALDMVAIPVARINAMLFSEIKRNIFTLLLSLLALFLGIYLISRFVITNRLKRISNHFSESLGEENIIEIPKIEENGNDEIGLLAENFNRLIARLNELYQSLEAKVNERTRELYETNVRLLKEIKEKELAEKRLKEAEEKYRRFIEQAPFGISFIDEEGNYTYVNPEFSQIFGWTLKDVSSGKEWFHRAYPDPILRHQAISFWINDTEGMNPGQSTSRIFDVQCSGGEIKTINFIVVKIKENEFCIIYEDITEKRMLEAQLIHSQKMESIGTLAGGIAHDFNNLIQGILGYTQILLLEANGNKERVTKLKGIERAAKRAGELTSQLLTFGRKVESRLEPVDINNEITQIMELLRRTIPRMIDIEFHAGKGLWSVNADPTQIEQVILNIAVNARDAMPDGGKLIIETDNVTLDQVYCRSHMGAIPGDYVLISITDTGCGMPPEILEHIFEPFYTTKETGKGTGLGLATVYGIVKNHKGYIMCYSEVGKGTTFKIYLPAIDGHHVKEDEETEFNLDETGNGELILFVDDDDEVREMGRNLLMKFGYRTITASSGEEAIQKFRRMKEKISLIILDLIMPGMGGKKALDDILSIDPSARVVISSGFSASAHAKDALNSGAVGFINKPYNINQMLSVIQDAMNNHAASK